MLINVTTEHQNPLLAIQALTRPSVGVTQPRKRISSPWLVLTIKEPSSLKIIHNLPKDNLCPDYWQQSSHFIFAAYSWDFWASPTISCVKCYWYWCFWVHLLAELCISEAYKNISTPYCTLVWRKIYTSVSLLSHRSLWKIKENQFIYSSIRKNMSRIILFAKMPWLKGFSDARRG